MRSFIIIAILSSISLFVKAQSDTLISFDGVNDICRYEGDSLTSAFSVDLYFKDCALDTAPRTLLSLDGFEVSVVGDSALASLVVKDFAANPQSTALSNYAVGNWNHIGVEYNPVNDQIVVLLNGFSIISITKAQFNWNGLLILGSNRSRSSHFEGQIDNVRISDTLRLGFIATIPQPPYSYDSITVALWNFDSLARFRAYTSRGDSMFVGSGAHPVVVYDDIIVQACEGEVLSFNFPLSGIGFSASPDTGFVWNDPMLEWTSVVGVETYYLNFNDSNSCLNTTLLQAEVFPHPEIALGSDTSLCEGDSVLLRGASSGSHLWSDSSGADSLWIHTPGSYWLEVVDNNSCRSSDSIHFMGLAAPQLELGNDTTLPRFGTLELDAGPGFIDYEWSTLESSQKILATLPSWYWVQVTDSNGCRASDSIYVLIEGLFPFGMDDEFEQEEIKVYPNPAHDVLNVDVSPKYEISSWAVVSMEGQLLEYSEEMESQISISLLDNGKYMLWLRGSDGKMLSYTFVKTFR